MQDPAQRERERQERLEYLRKAYGKHVEALVANWGRFAMVSLLNRDEIPDAVRHALTMIELPGWKPDPSYLLEACESNYKPLPQPAGSVEWMKTVIGSAILAYLNDAVDRFTRGAGVKPMIPMHGFPIGLRLWDGRGPQ